MTNPNFLFIVVDEWRYFPPYETKELRQWRQDNLKFYQTMRNSGIEFHNHYTNNTACSPSRTTLQTGVYPSIHGVTCTDAVAKTSHDKDMIWLKQFTVPTIGNYMTERGYKTILKGKWHVSNAGIRGESGDEISTFDFYGNPIPELEEFYIEKNVLSSFGYNEWIGPECHGRVGINTASSVPANKIGRDEKFVNQTLNTLEILDSQDTPWFLSLNLLDPHDIVLLGALTTQLPENFNFAIDESLPETMFTSEFFNDSLMEDLTKKPPAQRSYRDLYKDVFQPIINLHQYWKYYYTLMKRVDSQLMKIWSKLTTMKSYHNTIIIFTSDHGDMLGSHGRMFQKWYQAYQETIHIPLIISSPLFGTEHSDIYDLTSHIDLLPTILDMSNSNSRELRRKLSARFSLAIPLPGSSILPLIMGESVKSRPVYFYTEDNVTNGQNQKNALGIPYPSVVEPSSIEAILVLINNQLWKYTSYYTKDNPSFEANMPHELYNITQDPFELTSLYNNPEYKETQQQLKIIMAEYSFRYRLIRNM